MIINLHLIYRLLWFVYRVEIFIIQQYYNKILQLWNK